MARPDISIQIFPIQAAAWRKEPKDGNGRPWWSIKISKRQKARNPQGMDVLDANGKPTYEDSNWYSGDDLLKVSALALEIHRQTSIEDRS